MKSIHTSRWLIAAIFFLGILEILIISHRSAQTVQIHEITENELTSQRTSSILLILSPDCPNCSMLSEQLSTGIEGNYQVDLLSLTSDNRDQVLARFPIKYVPAIVISHEAETTFHYIKDWQNPGWEMSRILHTYCPE